MDQTRSLVVLVTLGTRGDVQPFLQLTRALVGEGFEVRFLSNENWRDEAEAAGGRFVAVAPAEPPHGDRDQRRHFRRDLLPAYERIYEDIRINVDPTRSILLYLLHNAGAECVAEHRRIPSFRIVLQPAAVFSWSAPPLPVGRLAQGWLHRASGGRTTRLALRLIDRLDQRRGPTNRFRRRKGAQPVRSGIQLQGGEDAILYMFPKWFGRPQADWPARSRFLGFPNPAPQPMDSRVADFIAAAGAPLVFTPGTGVSDVAGFFRTAAAACRALGAPGLFLSPHAPVSLDPDHLSLPFADLDSILPHARLLVHHGGIGSAAAAIRAGVPQIICPRRFDQPDNAFRIARLGLGAAILPQRFDEERLVQACRAVTASELVAARVKLARAHAAREDGISACVQLLRRVASAPAASRPEVPARVG